MKRMLEWQMNMFVILVEDLGEMNMVIVKSYMKKIAKGSQLLKRTIHFSIVHKQKLGFVGIAKRQWIKNTVLKNVRLRASKKEIMEKKFIESAIHDIQKLIDFANKKNLTSYASALGDALPILNELIAARAKTIEWIMDNHKIFIHVFPVIDGNDMWKFQLIAIEHEAITITNASKGCQDDMNDTWLYEEAVQIGIERAMELVQ